MLKFLVSGGRDPPSLPPGRVPTDSSESWICYRFLDDEFHRFDLAARQGYRLGPCAATINIIVSLKSTRAFKANHADLRIMQSLRLFSAVLCESCALCVNGNFNAEAAEIRRGSPRIPDLATLPLFTDLNAFANRLRNLVAFVAHVRRIQTTITTGHTRECDDLVSLRIRSGNVDQSG
jgi:hypothetical protein